MKILLIRTLNPFFDSSASGNRFASLVDGLINIGVKIEILVINGYNISSEKKLCQELTNSKKIKFNYLVKSYNDSIWKRRFNIYVLNRLCRQIIKNSIIRHILNFSGDYVWLTNNELILSSYIDIHNRMPCKSLIETNEFHDIYKLEGKTTNSLQLKLAREREHAFLKSIRWIDCFAVMTQTLLEYYKTSAKSSAAFIHLPMTVDISRFDTINRTLEQEKYIAFAGSFDNKKDGLDILIESFGRLHTKYPNWKLKIAGFYHKDMEIQKQLILKLGITEKVEYVGVLAKEQIPQFLINASILALARPDSHQAQGGFPTKLGEYLATKNPVCVTSVGEIGDYLNDNISAFLAIPGNVDSFTNALNRAMSDQYNAKKVGLKGYEVARANFDKDVQAKRLYNFLIENLNN